MPLTRSVARGVALFFGAFSLLNLLGDLRARGFDANGWWIDFRPLPGSVGKCVLLLAAGAMLAYGVRPAVRRWRRALTASVLMMILAVSVGNAVGFLILLARGTVRSSFPIPLSLLVGAAMGLVIAAVLRSSSVVPQDRVRLATQRLTIALTVLACAVLFPLGQMLCFGKTDYRRRADVAVVFGARVYRDGELSVAVADRVDTACRLYQQGLVAGLILSGGPGDGEIDEPTAMRARAVKLGVPAEAIRLDPAGLNTDATARNTALLLSAGSPRILAVSHFYHLPRIKLSYQRLGIDVRTVPAEETYTLSQMPRLVAREVVALWVYYLRPLGR